MTKPRGLLFARMDIPAELEGEFNDWYNREHLAWRLERAPGFLSGRRFRALEGTPKYAAAYDLESVDVLQSPAYLSIRQEERANPTPEFQRVYPRFQNLKRGVYEEITPDPTDYRPPAEGRILLVAMLVPRPEHEDEFNAWYNTEHLPALRSVSGILTARRFRAVEGEPKYVALYDVTSYDVFKGQEYLTKRESPWATRIRSLLASRERCVYERIFPPVG
ncbi:MAG: hypothetical protein HY691_18995 [Chloroflexi bacterium]|nr:hypothetical protein [Chloroflexota bacterium]